MIVKSTAGECIKFLLLFHTKGQFSVVSWIVLAYNVSFNVEKTYDIASRYNTNGLGSQFRLETERVLR